MLSNDYELETGSSEVLYGMQGFLTLDVFSTVPWDLLLTSGSLRLAKLFKVGKVVKLIRIVRVLKLIRILRLLKVCKDELQDLQDSRYWACRHVSPCHAGAKLV